MQFLVILVIGLAPGVFWLWLIYRWDKYQPEPRWLVIRTFMLGMAVVLPVGLVELILLYINSPGGMTIGDISQLSLGGMAYLAFIVAGFTEELGKFLVVRSTMYASPYFNEPADGVVYSAAVALGFASLENVGYLAAYGWQNILVRGPISTTAHLLFSILWGYPLALRKMGWRWGRLFTWLGLLGAMVAHGLFDFLLFTQSWYTLLAIPVFAGLVVLLVAIMRYSRKLSAIRHHIVELLKACPQCGNTVPFYAQYCIFCGSKLPQAIENDRLLCGKCGQSLTKDSIYCTACGSRVVRKPLPK